MWWILLRKDDLFHWGSFIQSGWIFIFTSFKLQLSSCWSTATMKPTQSCEGRRRWPSTMATTRSSTASWRGGIYPWRNWFLLCWLFLHFVGWLRRMFGNGYVTSIAIDLLRSFDACYHAELQDMWYKAHYKEAEKIRARPLGEYKVFGFLTFGWYVRRLQREKRMKNELLFIASINARVILNFFISL